MQKRTDQIFCHAPRNSRVAAHGAHQLQAPNAPGLGDSQGRLQDPVRQWDQDVGRRQGAHLWRLLWAWGLAGCRVFPADLHRGCVAPRADAPSETQPTCNLVCLQAWNALERGCLSGSVSLGAGIEVWTPRPLIPLICSLKNSKPLRRVRRHKREDLPHCNSFRKYPAIFHPMTTPIWCLYFRWIQDSFYLASQRVFST